MVEKNLMEMTDRQADEKEFHNQWSKDIDVRQIDVEIGFMSPTAAENSSILRWFGNIEGAKILDLGSGMGDTGVYFAKQGADVVAIDISDGMVEVSRRLAESQGVSERFTSQQMAAEKLKFDDATFDLVYGNGVLHHVDITSAIKEVYRVLRPGGKAAFIEPLAYNPVIWGYRFLAKAVRSENERPLSRKDIHQIIHHPPNGNSQVCWHEAEHKEYHLATLSLMLWFFLGEKISPAKERYWKLFLEKGPKYQKTYRYLEAIDKQLYEKVPFTRWLSWNTVIYLQK